jgi:predicted house-cleaning noncanonical NTP pyrophosphatase (MazG superfamily)
MDKKEKELNQKIMEITTMISEKYPELYVQLEEMRDTLTNKVHPEVNEVSLEEYYESLMSMVKRYLEERNKSDLQILKRK